MSRTGPTSRVPIPRPCRAGSTPITCRYQYGWAGWAMCAAAAKRTTLPNDPGEARHIRAPAGPTLRRGRAPARRRARSRPGPRAPPAAARRRSWRVRLAGSRRGLPALARRVARRAPAGGEGVAREQQLARNTDRRLVRPGGPPRRQRQQRCLDAAGEAVAGALAALVHGDGDAVVDARALQPERLRHPGPVASK